jgi:FMN phosphatase YigB (HAD superfamily)
MADVLKWLCERGVPMGLVADTRDGTYHNVLNMHGLFDLFSVFAISDHLGVVKPDRRMFMHALEGLGIPESGWGDVAMVGNNLSRDIRGANALGLISVWLAWNRRYPCICADDAETPDFQVSTAAGLRNLLEGLFSGGDTSSFAHPQPFPWDEVS